MVIGFGSAGDSVHSMLLEVSFESCAQIIQIASRCALVHFIKKDSFSAFQVASCGRVVVVSSVVQDHQG